MESTARPIVVVGVDGSDHSMTAVARAIEEARNRGAELHVVHVSDLVVGLFYVADSIPVDTAALVKAQREGVWDTVNPALEGLDIPVVKADVDGYPSDKLVEYCDEKGASLLVLGTRGRGRLASTFLGSTSMRSLEHASCDVLIAKPR